MEPIPPTLWDVDAPLAIPPPPLLRRETTSVYPSTQPSRHGSKEEVSSQEEEEDEPIYNSQPGRYWPEFEQLVPPNSPSPGGHFTGGDVGGDGALRVGNVPERTLSDHGDPQTLSVPAPAPLSPVRGHCSECGAKSVSVVRFVAEPWRLPICRDCAVVHAKTYTKPPTSPPKRPQFNRRRRRRPRVSTSQAAGTAASRSEKKKKQD